MKKLNKFNKIEVNFDWENIYNMESPIQPVVENLLDTSNFDKSKIYTEEE